MDLASFPHNQAIRGREHTVAAVTDSFPREDRTQATIGLFTDGVSPVVRDGLGQRAAIATLLGAKEGVS